MNNDTSLKEYYLNLQTLYNKAINMLMALNSSLTTSSSEIELNVGDTDDASSIIKVPSFVYLENKLEELNANMDELFNIPEDGEAWFTKSENMYKLNLIRSNTAPISPIIDTRNVNASITDNNFLKDMVTPKTYLKLNLSNLPDNVSEMFMRKVVVHDYKIFEAIRNLSANNLISYSDCSALLYNLKKGIDYDEYDSVIELPIKKEMFASNFRIEEIIENSWIDLESSKINYKIRLNTLIYSNEEDPSISYSLKPGDKICLGNAMTVFNIKQVFNNQTIQIEEYIGHTVLTTFEENSEMVFQIYIADYSKYHYAQVPLEENQYIIVFLGTIWNNVRSLLSNGFVVDLNTIKMVDNAGQPILDSNNNQYSYMSYYEDYCTNLGDIILGMSKCAYSQISNYTTTDLTNLLGSDIIKNAVNISVDVNSNLKVVAINKHLVDDASNQDIINLHNQKNEVNAKLQTCQSNIDQVYSTMLTTDFSQNVVVTQASLQEKIQGYYTERIMLQKQLNAIIDNINSKASTLTTSESRTKYRIRGISDTSILDQHLKENYLNVQLIGIDIEYKYKSTSKDTATLTTINSATFTDWNRQITYDKERVLEFANGGYGIKFKDDSVISNVIKWNQFDIPIKEGEDVVIRYRYKYSVGQPFITLYTPWSDEKTIIFPTEFTENVEVDSILNSNSKDTISATFNKTLIDEGYTEHIQNKVLSNEQVFFHMPENIYSGFNTPENNLISLKDKLTEISNSIDKYKDYIDSISNNAFEVYLNYDDNQVLLSPNSLNKINIYNTEHLTDMFIKKEMNIVIKNTGSSNLKFYSIFPGNINEHLITSSNDSYAVNKGDYERVPMFVSDKLDGQYLGQWIYFRQNSPYSKANVYFDDIYQNAMDYSASLEKSKEEKLEYIYSFANYINKNNSQALLGFRNNIYVSGFNYAKLNDVDDVVSAVEEWEKSKDAVSKEKVTNFDFFKYTNYNDLSKYNELTDEEKINKLYINKYILRYEDFIIQNSTGSAASYLTSETSITDSINKGIWLQNDNNTDPITITTSSQLIGAFLYPNILSTAQVLTDGKQFSYKSISVGGSVSIPIVFEYYVEASLSSITKSLYFDLRNSLINDPIHFMIEVTGNFDYSTTGEIYSDIDKLDE
jgi:hypothetical protein